MQIRRRMVRRAALAAALAVVPLAGTAGAESPPLWFSITRLAGPDRLATARSIAHDAFLPEGTGAVIVTRADAFPDALAGSYTAGLLGAPVLLTDTAALSADTLASIGGLKATSAVVLGSPAVVSANVVGQLESRGIAVTRVAGNDRFETAAGIAAAAGPGAVGLDDQGRRTAFLASGRAFPDALAAGPISYRRHFPLLLTEPGGLPATTAASIQNLDIERVIVLGGTGAVAPAVETQVAALGVDVVERVAGGDRFATAAMVANLGVAQFGLSAHHVDIAFGHNFPDALAGGPHAGSYGGVILLTETASVPAPTCDFLEANIATLDVGHVLGGTSVITDAAATVLASCGRSDEEPGVQLPTPVLGQPNLEGTTLGTRCEDPMARFNFLDDGGFDMHGPAGVAVAPNGRLFVADFGGKRVLSWPNVESLSACQPADVSLPANPAFAGPESVAVGPDGLVYVADTLSHTVQVFGPMGGQYVWLDTMGSFGNSGDEMDRFFYPRGLAVTADRLFVADDYNARILIFDLPIVPATHAADDLITAGNDGGFDHPKAVAVSGEHLYVADYGSNRVLRFTGPFDDPNEVYPVTATYGGVGNPVDLATFGDDLYVTEPSDPAVAVFVDAAAGSMAAPTRSIVDNLGMETLGLALDAKGRLYVADYRHYRVLIFPPGA